MSLSNAYVYRTSRPDVVVVVPTLAEADPYAGPRPAWLSDADFNLSSPASSATLKQMRAAAGDAGVRLNLQACAYIDRAERIPALEP